MRVVLLRSLNGVFLKAEKPEPNLERPYLAPGFPFVPYLALALALGSFVAVFYYNLAIGIIFALVSLSFAYFSFRSRFKTEKPS